MSTVTIVTVSYYSGSRLEALFASISAAATAPVRVIVANNAVDDRSLQAIPRSGLDVTVVECGANLGYGGAVNRAIAATDDASDWILVANPDLTFAAGSIDELLRVAESDATIGVAGPLIYTPGGEVYPSARRLPSLRSGIGHALFSRAWKSNPWTARYLADRENPPRERDAGWLSGSCLLVRRSVFEAVGGFDDRFFMYFEDVDLCARIGAAGWRVVYAPSSVITHEGGHATKAVSRTMIRAHHSSAYLYLAARYRAWYLWPLRLALRVGLMIRAEFAKS